MKGALQKVILVAIVLNAVRGRFLLVGVGKEKQHKESSGTIQNIDKLIE